MLTCGELHTNKIAHAYWWPEVVTQSWLGQGMHHVPRSTLVGSMLSGVLLLRIS